VSQPVWKTLRALGDLGRIYADETGVYTPEAEVWIEYAPDASEEFPDDECDSRADNPDADDYWCRATRAQHAVEAGGTGKDVSAEACRHFTLDRRNRQRFKVYRIILDQLERKQLPDGDSTIDDWFDLYSVARSAGVTHESLVDGFSSADPVDRYWAYDAVGRYHGWDNFDQYPLDLSEKELRAREDAQDAKERWGQRRAAITALTTVPHARCANSPTCVEHAHNKRVPSCKKPAPRAPSRGKGRRLP
jgi:hypothetical protein